jgi:hypothetical protein
VVIFYAKQNEGQSQNIPHFLCKGGREGGKKRSIRMLVLNIKPKPTTQIAIK